jgi:EmrB/QacA subfamily drug resistance transporter
MATSAASQRGWVILNIGLGVYMSTLDASVVNLTLPTITRALKTDLTAVAWVVMGYLIVITGCLLLAGKLADLFGTKRVYLLGFVVFTAGSALCGLAPNVQALIGFRMVQGLGAAALMALGPAIITGVFPDKDRGKALGIVGSVVSAGFLTGPVAGGFIVEHLGWRWVFYLNLPIGLFGIYLSSRYLDGRSQPGRGHLDLKGALLLFVSIASFLLLLNQVSHGPSARLWGWLGASLVTLALLVAVETRSAFPILDLRLFKKRVFSASLGASLLSFWMNASHAFVIPFFLQTILGYPPSKVGMLIFPVSLTVMVMAPLGGRISDRMGVRVPATLGLALISLAISSFVLLKGDEGNLAILWRQVVLGLGLGLFNPANNSAILGSLPREMAGLASSFLALSRNLGMVIGVAFAEMVIALAAVQGKGGGGPSLAGIQRVWELALLIGLVAILISWTRKREEESR